MHTAPSRKGVAGRVLDLENEVGNPGATDRDRHEALAAGCRASRVRYTVEVMVERFAARIEGALVFKAWRNDPVFRVLQWAHRRVAVGSTVSLAPSVHVGFGSVLWAPRRLTVDADTYIGRYCTIMCDGRIGRWVSIGNNVGLVGRYDHDYRAIGYPLRRAPWIGDADYRGPGRGLEVVIGDDVWVGFGAVILSGVTVGRGAIVAAGAVVTRDVEPYSIQAGNPAGCVGRRFSAVEISRHETTLQDRWRTESAGP